MKNKSETDLRQEFVAFVETSPQAPGQALDDAIVERIGTDLSRRHWRLCGKLTLIQILTGLATLSACPQFGLGSGHLSLIHDLHRGVSPIMFYLICGLLFVSLGGLLSGLILQHNELAQVNRWRYRYFLTYAGLVYLILVLIGPEAFVASSLAWIPGAVLGNITGFKLICRLLRQLS